MDGHRLPRAVSVYLRRLGVGRVLEGERPGAVSQSLGLCPTALYRWVARWRVQGEASFQPRWRSGRPRRLSPAQGEQVRAWLDGHDPRDYGFAPALWDRSLVRALLKDRLGLDLGLSATGELLHRLGLSRHQPLRRAYERDPVAVEQWQRTTFPELKRLAQQANAQIFFWDEAGVRTNEKLGKTWAPIGQRPCVNLSGKRDGVNVASAVTERGGFWFCTYPENLNHQVFIRLLTHFMKGRHGPVYLILDGYAVHKTPEVLDYVLALQGRLELHFLPGYASDLNPHERVWNYLKTTDTRKTPLRQKEKMRSRVDDDMEAIKVRPALVRSFFHAPGLAYIQEADHVKS